MTDSQPEPTQNDQPYVQERAIASLVERQRHGIQTYGTGLQVGNGRKMIKDLREELEDALIYVTGVEMMDEELVQILTHVVALHSMLDDQCQTCDSIFPCHTRVDLLRALDLLGERHGS